MDPNLKTLSLAAWMSLPNLDFATWESQNRDESIDNKCPVQVGLTQQSLSSNNSKTPKPLTNSCKKCQSLREKNFGHFASSERRSCNILLKNSEVSPSACNCSKVSHKFNLTDDKRVTVNDVKSKGIKRISIAPNQVSQRETQSRALVSKVAKYYESYVTQMKLQKYFVNDVTVTSIVPIHWKDPKCKGARWIVVGYVLSLNQKSSNVVQEFFFHFLAGKRHREKHFLIAAKMLY